MPCIGIGLAKFATLNYYSHYYFDRIEGNSHYNFGLLLPDFVRNFTAGQRLHPGAIIFDNQQLNDIYAGANRHFTIDKTFHGSSVFKTCCRIVEDLIREPFANLALPRVFFAAHILVELVLDRILMQEDEGKTLERLYLDFAEITQPVLLSYWEHNNLSQFEAFWERFRRFCEIKYLHLYTDNGKLAFSLSRIYLYSKATTEWSEDQVNGVSLLADEIETQIRPYITEFKELLK